MSINHRFSYCYRSSLSEFLWRISKFSYTQWRCEPKHHQNSNFSASLCRPRGRCSCIYLYTCSKQRPQQVIKPACHKNNLANFGSELDVIQTTVTSIEFEKIHKTDSNRKKSKIQKLLLVCTTFFWSECWVFWYQCWYQRNSNSREGKSFICCLYVGSSRKRTVFQFPIFTE